MLISLTGQTIGGPNDPKSDYGDTCKFDSPITNYLWLIGLSGMAEDEISFGDMSWLARIGRRILVAESDGSVLSYRCANVGWAKATMENCRRDAASDIDPTLWVQRYASVGRVVHRSTDTNYYLRDFT